MKSFGVTRLWPMPALLWQAPIQPPSEIHNEILSRIVDEQMALEEEAQRDDWHGQLVLRLGPRYLDPAEMYE